MSALVYCEEHSPYGPLPVAHERTPKCVNPHYAGPAGSEPSMTAVETLDPRDASKNESGRPGWSPDGL